MHNDNSIFLIADKIVRELRNGYGLTGYEYEELVRKYGDMKVSIIKMDAERITYNFYTQTGEPYGLVTGKQFGQSHVAEYPPIRKENTIVPILPIINLQYYYDQNEFYSSAYHELVHYFSIGTWNIRFRDKDRMIVEHYSGIIKRVYTYSQNKIVLQSTESDVLNEAITDYIARILYERIENKPYHSGVTYAETSAYAYLEQTLLTDQEKNKFINLYLTNKVEIIYDFLRKNKDTLYKIRII